MTTVRQVENLREPDKPWCLQWRTATMPASAFWYFCTEEEALAEEKKLRVVHKVAERTAEKED
jgi:hypothetical protein